jgi:[ribosomal protein S5]-alanine N-acetyltransferase
VSRNPKAIPWAESVLSETRTSPTLPRFETKRLVLREVTLEDIPAYKKHFVDYEVIRYLSAHVPWPYPEDGIETFLKEKVFPVQGQGKWLWGLYLKTHPQELIGVVELWRPGRPENRGFWLGRQFWGQGLMTEAVAPVMNYAFEELGFETLTFANAHGNMGSRRVKEKTGARLIGLEPASFVDPRFTEHEIWELTKEAWKNHQCTP